MKLIHFLTFLLIVFFLASCNKAIVYNDPIPKHTTFTIESSQVGEARTINVWVPAGYDLGTDSLPVMYMADGGIEEDFPHIANTFDTLLKAGKIQPMILVGIENTERRRDLTGTTEVEKDKEIAPVVGGSAKFRAFISDELMPEINKRYRTNNHNGILGESLSGLFVMETFLLQPDLFDYYIAFDPSLWWNDHLLVKKSKGYLAQFPTDKKVLWFASSDASDIQLYSRELADILKYENIDQLRWTYSDEPNEHHNTIFRATKEKALIWALGLNN